MEKYYIDIICNEIRILTERNKTFEICKEIIEENVETVEDEDKYSEHDMGNRYGAYKINEKFKSDVDFYITETKNKINYLSNIKLAMEYYVENFTKILNEHCI